MRELGKTRIHLCMKNNIESILQNMKANDDEEERKYVLGFCCERYDDTVKKLNLICLYMGKKFHHGRIRASKE